MSTSLQQFDLFSLPFLFNLHGNEKTRKTKFGGLVSIMIILTALAYFIYLLYLYFGNQINPSFTQFEQQINYSFQMNVTNDILAFKIILKSGETLVQRQEETGLVYLNLIAEYVEKSSIPNQKSNITNLNFVKCEDPLLSDYSCLDFSPVSKNKLEMPFDFDNKFLGKYSIAVKFIICDQKLLLPSQKCATPQQIRQEVLTLGTQGVLRIKTQQFDPNSQKYIDKVRHELFSFNDFLCNISSIALFSANTTISSGFIIQNQKLNSYFFDFQRTHTTNTIQFMNEEEGYNLANYIYIYIGNTGMTQVVSYPQFTSLLAQFASVLNTLLIIGIICKFFSQNQILQDFVDIQIKTHYKKTAWTLLKCQNKNQVCSKSSTPFQYFSQIHFQIQNMNFKQQMGKFLQLSFFEKLKLQLIGSNNPEQQEKDKKEIKIYKELLKQTQKQLNITELQKEIMSIKIILRLLLSVEQYAAIQLCGYSVLKENKALDEDLKVNKSQKDQNDKKSLKGYSSVSIQNQQQSQNANSEWKQTEQINGLIEKTQSNIPLKDNQNNEQKEKDTIERDLNKQNHRKNLQEKYIAQDQQIQLTNIKKQPTQEIDSENVDLLKINLLDIQQSPQAQQSLLQNNIIKDHLEKIDLVDSDQNYFEKCLENFFKKYHHKSDLDRRILGCMIGYDQEIFENTPKS
ncbi:transmembrane protein, putative (macronuclear) [Tetrahymena thermophila SB210]|uniref:Transmembrane protein, putative n=1 Tax=Tetrahymena thermophila (strain SB210) TaxID=312017 RepID=I7M176_TETTS|nr:transmembrane protein, putative [Tetrahymena thermophila SB210]EAR95645.2 transmembrane protein, putative [Tetrahymena thermophila SB210]|eukprot:XP_001015890.2 transmembrane protein, putative [Tetrahymena thermophila SB210]